MKEKNPVKRVSTTCRFHLIRNRYYAGKISHEECLESLLKLYHDRDKNLYDVSGIVENMQLPSDIIRLIWKDELTTEELDNLLLMLTSTLIGLIVMILYKERTWCSFCPMGTMTQGICKIKAGKEIEKT